MKTSCFKRSEQRLSLESQKIEVLERNKIYQNENKFNSKLKVDYIFSYLTASQSLYVAQDKEKEDKIDKATQAR